MSCIVEQMYLCLIFCSHHEDSNHICLVHHICIIDKTYCIFQVILRNFKMENKKNLLKVTRVHSLPICNVRHTLRTHPRAAWHRGPESALCGGGVRGHYRARRCASTLHGQLHFIFTKLHWRGHRAFMLLKKGSGRPRTHPVYQRVRHCRNLFLYQGTDRDRDWDKYAECRELRSWREPSPRSVSPGFWSQIQINRECEREQEMRWEGCAKLCGGLAPAGWLERMIRANRQWLGQWEGATGHRL